MDKSESIIKLSEALVEAQSKMPSVKMNKINPFLKNHYADLGAIIETAQPILAKNGLGISQHCSTNGDKVGVETILIHKSGEWISSKMELSLGEEKGKSNAQVAGSIITYIRRYSLAAILGMYSDEDSDGDTDKATHDTSHKPIKTPQKAPKQAISEASPERATDTTLKEIPPQIATVTLFSGDIIGETPFATIEAIRKDAMERNLGSKVTHIADAVVPNFSSSDMDWEDINDKDMIEIIFRLTGVRMEADD